MFDYLQKFNSLPQELRDKVSGPEAMRAILDLEAKYKVDLAALIMKIMVKSITLDSLVDYFINEASLPENQAKSLNQELHDKIFSLVAKHLGIEKTVSEIVKDASIEKIIKDAGIILPSSSLLDRLEKIIATYQKGIRSKIDTKASLSKGIEFGGLNLSESEIDKLFRVLSGKDTAPTSVNQLSEEQKAASKAKLDRIIMQAEAVALPSGDKPVLGGYDLRKSIEEMKKPVNKIDLEEVAPRKQEIKTKEIEAPEELELLPLEEKELLLTAGKPKEESVKKEEPKSIEELPVEAKIEKTQIKSEIIPEEEKKIKFSEPQEEVQPLPVNMNFKRPEPLGNASRPIIRDIKPVPKIMSPIEELQFLDLVNFRRLGASPQEISDKIFAKIKLLERDGYDKMIQGVSAWRKSEVNRLYLKMGQEAVLGGISLKEAMLNRQKASKDHLNLEEIEAVSKLNSRLAF